MSQKTTFQANSCFWYYGLVTILTLFLCWGVYLTAYSYGLWTNFVQVWEYSNNSIIMMVFWSIFLVLFMWGAYHADCEPIPGELVEIYRFFYLVMMLLSLFFFILYYNAAMVTEALMALLLMISICIGIIGVYTVFNFEEGWFVFPYFLWLCYMLYSGAKIKYKF